MHTTKRFRIFSIILLAVAVNGCAVKQREAVKITPDKFKSELSTQKSAVQQAPQSEAVAPVKNTADPF